MAIDRTSSLQIINTQYSVFFGIIFGLSFYVNATTPPSVDLSIPSENIPIMLFMSLYYIADWFTANILPKRIPISTVVLFLQVLGVVFLGVTIVLMNSNGLMKYILFGAYGSLAGIYDIFLQLRLTRQIKEGWEAATLPFGLFIAVVRFVLSLAVLIPASIGVFRTDVAELLGYIPALVISIVGVKIWRFMFLDQQLPVHQEYNI